MVAISMRELHADTVPTDGPVLLWLHGAPSTPESLEAWARALGTRAQSFVGDLPGYGNTPALGGASLEATHAALETSVVHRIGERPVHVIGFSGGAYRAFDLAARGVLRVASVVALGGTAFFPDEMQRALHQLADALVSTPFDLEAAALQMLTERSRAEPAMAAAVKTWAHATSTLNLSAELHALAAGRDLRAEVPRDLPVLMRTGELDANVPFALARATHDALAGSELQEVAARGHALPIEDHEQTLAALAAFLLPRLPA